MLSLCLRSEVKKDALLYAIHNQKIYINRSLAIEIAKNICEVW